MVILAHMLQEGPVVKPTLDLAVSRAIMALHTLETALHDNGPWSVEIQGRSFPANRYVLDDAVQFCVALPDNLLPGTHPAFLTCGKRSLSTMLVDVPESGEFIVDWVVRLRLPVAA